MSDSKPFVAAFPLNTGNSAEPGSLCPETGMSLRDWFAGQTLSGLSSSSSIYEAIVETSIKAGVEPAEGFAALAYQIADAMMAERDGR